MRTLSNIVALLAILFIAWVVVSDIFDLSNKIIAYLIIGVGIILFLINILRNITRI